MKKKVFAISALIITVCGLLSIFVTLLFSSYKISNTNVQSSTKPFPTDYVPYLVSKGDVVYYDSYETICESIDNSNEIIEMDVNKDSAEVGEYISKGKTIGNVTFDIYGRIYDVQENGEKDKVKIINYSNRQFVSYIENNKINIFKYGTSFSIYTGNEFCKATVTYIDYLMEESTQDAIKVVLTIDENSLNNDNLFLMVGSKCSIRFNERKVNNVLRCFKAAIPEVHLYEGASVDMVVRSKETNKFHSCIIDIGIVGDAYVEISGSNIFEGDYICA